MPLIRPEDLSPKIAAKSFEMITKHLSPSVGGIYTTLDRKIVRHIASCVFVRYRGRDYIATATHVLKENPGLPIIVGTSKGTGQFAGEFRFLKDEDLLDVAIARMPPALREKLPDAVFYDIGHCEHQRKWEPDRCVIFGMPNSRNKLKPREKVPSQRGVFGFLTVPLEDQTVPGRPKITGDTHIVLDWTAQRTTKVDGTRWNPPALKGTSGGAIMNLGYWDEDVYATLRPPMPTIDGVMSLWVGEKIAVGVRFYAVISALNQANAWPALVAA